MKYKNVIEGYLNYFGEVYEQAKLERMLHGVDMEIKGNGKRLLNRKRNKEDKVLQYVDSSSNSNSNSNGNGVIKIKKRKYNKKSKKTKEDKMIIMNHNKHKHVNNNNSNKIYSYSYSTKQYQKKIKPGTYWPKLKI